MKISTLYTHARPVLSFEAFPPKKDSTLDQIDGVYCAVDGLAGERPDFISVTYGAAGSNSNRTAEIAEHIQKQGIPALAHLTCVGTSRNELKNRLNALNNAGIANILALRGDLPKEQCANGEFAHASEMIETVRGDGRFCIGAACYPEGHIDAESFGSDLRFLRKKQESGAEFFISQLFFDNDVFARFLESARKAGVTVPISVGVMPMFSKAQVQRMIFMCGASLPASLIRLIHKYEDDPSALEAAGVEYAAEQIRGLRRVGVDGIHIYTMNKPDVGKRLIAAARG